MTFYREEFPVTKDSVYFDVAHKASVPNCVIHSIMEFYKDVQQTGGDKERWSDTTLAVKEKIGRLINAVLEEIALVPNTVYGLNFLANGLKYFKGDNVIISDQEHVSNIFPWTNLDRKGIEVRNVSSKEYFYTAADIEELIDDRTRVVSISHVSTVPGSKVDLKPISDVCNEKNIFFFVDGVQSLGAMNVNVKEMGIDAMATSGHKWLLSPYGMGFLYCSSDCVSKLESVFAGKLYTYDDQTKINTSLIQDARKWEIGSLNYSAVYGMNAALDMILDIGIEKIENRILQLVNLLRQALKELGLVITSPGNKNMSGIVAFECVKIPSELYKYLVDNKIYVSLRKDQIRISIHFYNDENDIDKFIEIMKKFL
ncbi:MAG: hypothetical protein VR72_12570 [Clostridiaceae bacterium BRH_c20a]|nr:MAG: hypothetical protein VR72_12570 [Clostridiaceae bacterium BRH_c20a]